MWDLDQKGPFLNWQKTVFFFISTFCFKRVNQQLYTRFVTMQSVFLSRPKRNVQKAHEALIAADPTNVFCILDYYFLFGEDDSAVRYVTCFLHASFTPLKETKQNTFDQNVSYYYSGYSNNDTRSIYKLYRRHDNTCSASLSYYVLERNWWNWL